MMKKWRPFWSYDVEKTEQWLSEMATEGKQLAGVHRMMRMFSFVEGAQEEVEYQIVYDKSQREWPRTLEDAGWKTAVVEGNWRFMRNGEAEVRAYPARDSLLKRNRLHSLVLTCISIYYAVQLIMPLMFIFLILSSSGEVNIIPSPFWSLTILYFLQVIGVIILTIQMTRKLRTFERKYYHTGLDEKLPVGKTFTKWKPNWMTAPDLLEAWLTDMALRGNHLVRMQGIRFTFEKGTPKHVSYICDYQWRPTPSYTEIHKSAGWQLKYTSSYSFLKYSIWAKVYGSGEPKPQLTYDMDERRAQFRKVVLAHWCSNLFGFAMIFLGLWISFSNALAFSWTPYQRFLVGGLIVAVFIQVYQSIRTIRYTMRMRES